jgi:hypothetical protein
MVAIFYRADVRKGSLKTIQSDYSATFLTELPPYRTFETIIEFAKKNRYLIDDVDKQKLAMIINQRMTLISYGSLYSVYVRDYRGGAEVEVGVSSKMGNYFLISPINRKVIALRLDRMLNDIKDAVNVYGSIDGKEY